MRTLLSVALFTGLVVPALSAQTAAAKPARNWGAAPAAFPSGAKMAVVSGDPGKAGVFTIELLMPSEYHIPPHFHPTAEHVEVKKGTLMVGMGDVLDLKQAKPLATGDTGTIPANDHHFAVAKGTVVVSITAMGPFAMTYVNAKDDPRKTGGAGY